MSNTHSQMDAAPSPELSVQSKLHAKRVLSLAGATLGVIESASLAVAMIGEGLALARGRLTKHAVKQVDLHRLQPLVEQFARMLAAQPVFREMFGAV